MIDPTTPIIEESVTTTTEPQIEQRTRSWLCVLRLHRRTRWSKPFPRKAIGIFSVILGGTTTRSESELWYQVRECLGCGEREERSV